LQATDLAISIVAAGHASTAPKDLQRSDCSVAHRMSSACCA
jgi:hypothetical protein